MKPVIYVIVNKSLDMSAGKLAAQVGHAVVGSFQVSSTEQRDAWKESDHRWMIILEAYDGHILRNIQDYLNDRGVACSPVIDEGVNEVHPFSLTVLGVEILDKDGTVASFFKGLKRYTGPVSENLVRSRIVWRSWRKR